MDEDKPFNARVFLYCSSNGAVQMKRNQVQVQKPTNASNPSLLNSSAGWQCHPKSKCFSPKPPRLGWRGLEPTTGGHDVPLRIFEPESPITSRVLIRVQLDYLWISVYCR